MVKLNIGKANIKEDKPKKNDPMKDYSKEELAELSEEVEEKTKETAINPNDLSVEDFNFTPEAIEVWNDEYENKNIIYHNSLTKQFLEFYIDHAELNDLTRINFDLLDEEQTEMVEDMIAELQMEEAVEKVANGDAKETTEIIKDGFIITEDNKILINPETEYQNNLYEFILDKKFKENRQKGIKSFDTILREVIETEQFTSLDEALEYVANKFGLKKSEFKAHINDGISPKEIKEKIKDFGYIKFLYGLLSDERIKVVGEFTEDELEMITKIDNLVNN